MCIRDRVRTVQQLFIYLFIYLLVLPAYYITVWRPSGGGFAAGRPAVGRRNTGSVTLTAAVGGCTPTGTGSAVKRCVCVCVSNLIQQKNCLVYSCTRNHPHRIDKYLQGGSKNNLLFFSEYVNKTEKIRSMWTNTNIYRENGALRDISRELFYVTIVLCLNIL